MARPKTPVEQRLAEEWEQLYHELVPRLKRLHQIEQAMRAMAVAPPKPKPNELATAIQELQALHPRPR